MGIPLVVGCPVGLLCASCVLHIKPNTKEIKGFIDKAQMNTLIGDQPPPQLHNLNILGIELMHYSDSKTTIPRLGNRLI